jgi:hypothetical protein
MQRVISGIACAVVVVFAMHVAHAADQVEQQAETVPLGGPRGATITIQPRAGSFFLTVAMSPVACFDKATNESVNRTKAECLALNGFCRSSFGKARRLTDDTLNSENSNAIFRGVTIQDAGLQGGKYRLQLVIPEDGIQSPSVRPSEIKPFDRSSALFARFGDHEATIDALGRTLDVELGKVMDDLAATKNKKAAMIEHIAALRAAGARRFAALRELIQSDNLLLDTTERPDLLGKVDAAESAWGKKVDSGLQSPVVKE